MIHPEDEVVCLECSFRKKLKNLPNPHWSTNLCPKCGEKGEFKLMVGVPEYEAEMRRRELSKQIYCFDCGNMGPIESFSFDGLDDYPERRCSECGSDHNQNAGTFPLCRVCQKNPVVENGEYECPACIRKGDEQLERLAQDTHDIWGEEDW